MKFKSYILASTLAIFTSNPTIADERGESEYPKPNSSTKQREMTESKIFKLELDDNWVGDSSAINGTLSGKVISEEEITELLQRNGPMHPSRMTLSLDGGQAKEVEHFQSELTVDSVMLSGVNKQLQQAKYQWETCLKIEIKEGPFTFCINSPLIPNRYLVQVDKRIDKKELANVVNMLNDKVNGRLDYLYDSVFHGFSSVISKDKLASLENASVVTNVLRDGLVHLYT